MSKLSRFLTIMQAIVFPFAMGALIAGIFYLKDSKYPLVAALIVLTSEICALKYEDIKRSFRKR